MVLTDFKLLKRSALDAFGKKKYSTLTTDILKSINLDLLQ